MQGRKVEYATIIIQRNSPCTHLEKMNLTAVVNGEDYLLGTGTSDKALDCQADPFNEGADQTAHQ